VAGNYSKALAILEPLAAQGGDYAQFQLGQMYKLGQGVKQDKAKALELFQMAAARGNKNAKIQAEFLLKYWCWLTFHLDR
jgi:TPR repeat protein